MFLDQVLEYPQRRPNHRIAVINRRYYGCSWSDTVHGMPIRVGWRHEAKRLQLRGYQLNSTLAAHKSGEELSIIAVITAPIVQVKAFNYLG